VFVGNSLVDKALALDKTKLNDRELGIQLAKPPSDDKNDGGDANGDRPRRPRRRGGPRRTGDGSSDSSGGDSHGNGNGNEGDGPDNRRRQGGGDGERGRGRGRRRFRGRGRGRGRGGPAGGSTGNAAPAGNAN